MLILELCAQGLDPRRARARTGGRLFELRTGHYMAIALPRVSKT